MQSPGRRSAIRYTFFLILVMLVGVYWTFLFVVFWGLPLSLGETLLGQGLLVTQFFGLVLNLTYLAEAVNTLAVPSSFRLNDPDLASSLPMVSIHMPVRAEPVDMLKTTLTALAHLDYPHYEVLIIDNNTPDLNLWRPIQAYCQELGFRFFHLDNWPGFKAGALNFALEQTDQRAELVAVVDADYVVKPDFLKKLVPLFTDPGIAYVQTPHDYRYDRTSRYERWCYMAYKYFFEIAMPVRHSHNSLIFVGTMGILRLKVLAQLGGWDEQSITEDAELGVRIARAGYSALYVNQSMGNGLMPFDFEGLKRQRYRWAFGGVRIIVKHWISLRPSISFRSMEELSGRQKYDYLLGGLQWFEAVVTFMGTLLLLGNCVFFVAGTSRSLYSDWALIASLPLLIIVSRIWIFTWIMKKRAVCSTQEALGGILILTSLTWTVVWACIRALGPGQGRFVRTNKFRDRHLWLRTWLTVRWEIGLGTVCLLSALAVLAANPSRAVSYLLAFLMLWQAGLYYLAPLLAAMNQMHGSE